MSHAAIRTKQRSGSAAGGCALKWVTRQGVRLDRAACVWLIKNYLDSGAEIVYLNAATLKGATEWGA